MSLSEPSEAVHLTASGRRAKQRPADLQREREFLDWCAEMDSGRDDEDRSWQAFIAMRDKARLKRRDDQRREARHARGLKRPGPAPSAERRCHDLPRRRPPGAKTKRQQRREEQSAREAQRVAARKERYLLWEQQHREEREEKKRLKREALLLLPLRAASEAVPRSRERTMLGQCEGTTQLGDRCQLHRASVHAAAAPLRRGERFCAHHDPARFTGVRCAGVKKKGGGGQCNVWSGARHADAEPLRRGSPFCHHHRVRCAGRTHAGARCSVTSSSTHEHAEPLRQGAEFCRHHQRPGEPGGDAEPSDEDDGEGSTEDEGPAVCDACGSYMLCCQCEALRTWQAEERERTRRMLLHADGGRADGYSSDELPGFGGVCDDSEDEHTSGW